MAYNTNEERLIVQGSEKITRDLLVNGGIEANTLTVNEVNTDNITGNNAVFDTVTANNFNVENIAINGQISDLNVANLAADSASFNNIVANGVTGDDGQVLGKVNGNIEWINVSGGSNIDTDNFAVNNLTVNVSADINSGNASNFNVADFVANNATFGSINANGELGNNGQVLGKNNGVLEWMDVSGGSIDKDNFVVNNITINNSATLGGFGVSSITVISEDAYNNLGAQARNEAFYLTSPNGNLYLRGIQYSPSANANVIQSSYTTYFKPSTGPSGFFPAGSHSLEFTNAVVINSNIWGNITSIYVTGGSFEPSGWNNNADVGVNANNANIIITNSNELYYTSTRSLYREGRNLTDTFFVNPSLVINGPANYDPWKYVTDASGMFGGCFNFNKPVNIGNNVTNMVEMFFRCKNFNSIVNIPENATNLYQAFSSCFNFNQPVSIPDSTEDLSGTFSNCENFNQPVTIPNSVIYMSGTFAGEMIYYGNTYICGFNCPINIPDSVTDMSWTFRLSKFNQPINIGKNVKSMYETFAGANLPYTERESPFAQEIALPENVSNLQNTFFLCNNFRDSSIPIHISHNIALGDTSNYIYNCLVNNYTGIAFDPSRILNDA